ncbi:hypothetical protein [Secundilactobacillus kimchicus]|uniref:hypothetical protein n=1 Tax=Secundilactobacillus kimchicus TaxID=528209 RepID=UPI000B214681|nr:hypothetical protein [Secundilactobacillus kimchicus]
MVQTTFLNLPVEKQKKVRQALLAEFRQHALAKAQVARIVKAARSPGEHSTPIFRI